MTSRLHSFSLCFILVFALTQTAVARQIEEDEHINLELEEAKLEVTLQTFAALNSAELRLADGIEGSVTMNVTDTPWGEVLDAVCKQHDLACDLLQRPEGQSPVLAVDLAVNSGLPAGFGETLDISLKDADLKQIIPLFEQVNGGLKVTHPEDLSGTVTLNLRRTPAPVVLTQMLRMNGYEPIWGEGTVEIVPMEDFETYLINMSLKDASLRELLTTFGTLLTGDIYGDVVVDIAPGVAGDVTVELKAVDHMTAFNLICGEVGCHWELSYGEPSVLKVQAATSDKAAMAAGHRPGSRPTEIGFQFNPLSGGGVDGVARLAWGTPVQVFDAPGGEQVATTWLSFGPDLTAVVPTIRQCDQSDVLLDPIVLPFEEKRFSLTSGELVFRQEAVKDLAPSGLGPKTARPACESSEDNAKNGIVAVRIQAKDEVGELPPGSRQLYVEDSLMMVTPVGSSRPAAAVLVLHQEDSVQHVAVLNPTADRQGIQMERFALKWGEPTKAQLQVGEQGYALELAFGPSPFNE